jgi:hypothetical protein
VTLFSLYLLAMLDGLLCGLRTSMGRCALIRKRVYYARALLRGVMGAQIISTLALAVLLLTILFSSHRDALRADLEAAAGRMLWIFFPYAALVLLNLALRLFPSTDIRSATSVFMLGPLTAVRPLVMIAGVLYGISACQLLESRLLGLFILALMLSLEYALNRRAARAQAIQIRLLVQGEDTEARVATITEV